MSLVRQREPLLLWALIISILLHLLLGWLLTVLPRLTQKPAEPEPMFVEVVPPRKRPPPRTRELEPPRTPPPAQRREQPAKRLGPDNRIAPRETAPVGEDTEDQQRTARAQRPPAQPAARRLPARPRRRGNSRRHRHRPAGAHGQPSTSSPP